MTTNHDTTPIEPSRFRKKPVVVEAMRYAGPNAAAMAVYQWVEANTQGSFDPLAAEVPESGVSIDPATGFMLIATLEGVMQAKPGDWIIRGVHGEFYPRKPDIFVATYEPAEDTTPPPVTVYGVQFADGDIEWCGDRYDAIDLMADEPAQIVTVTGHVRPDITEETDHV